MTSVVGGGPLRGDVRALFDGTACGVLITKDEAHGTLTYTRPGAPASDAGPRTEPMTVRVPITLDASRLVQHEARLLVELRRRRLGPIERTIPRHVGVRHLDGLPVAMASLVPGRPMSADYDGWLHVARPDQVRRDFRHASGWLSRFQEASRAGISRTTWAAEVVETLHDRADRHPLLADGLIRLAPAMDRLDGHLVGRTAVHGDYWHANLLVHEAEIGGVVNWSHGELEGWPMRDLVRFALRYSHHLVQQTRPGRRVTGHPGLRRVGPAPGIRYALVGGGWYPRIVRAHLRDGLVRLGVPAHLWYDAALVGIAELAAEARDGRAARELLAVLVSLPARP